MQIFLADSLQSVKMGFEKLKARASKGLNSLAGASVSLYRSVARCLHSRKYERLGDKRRKRVRVWKLRGPKGRSRVLVPKLKSKLAYPKLLVAKLRDSYVNKMLSLSATAFFSSRMMSNNLGSQCTSLVHPFGRIRNAQFDEIIIREMYKSALARGQLTHRSIALWLCLIWPDADLLLQLVCTVHIEFH